LALGIEKRMSGSRAAVRSVFLITIHLYGNG
jgi:hypothetical protein